MALKDSFIKVTFNRRTIFGFLFFIVALVTIWRYHLQIEWYNLNHGVITAAEPRKQAVAFMLYATIFTLILYLFIVVRSALKQIK